MSKQVERSRFVVEQVKVALTGRARAGVATLLLGSMIAPVIPAPVGQLPPIPKLAERKDEFDATIQEQIQKALEKLQMNPDSAEANGNLGMILHAHQRYELAEPLYLRAQLLDPNSFPWAYYLGVIRVPLGKQTEAVTALRLAVGLKPDYLPARMGLAESLQKLGEFEQSREIYQQILQDHPQSPSAYAGLGRVYWEEGKVAEAIKNYEKACELFPEFGSSHYALGLAYRTLGNAEKSREHLSQFQRHSTKEPPLDDPLLEAIQSLGSKTNYYLGKGRALRDQGQFKEAAAAFEEALKIEPDHAVAHGNLCSLYIALRDPDQVEQHYRAAVEIDPGMYKTHYNFAVFLGMVGRTLEAMEVLRKALDVNPFHALSHNNLGYLLAQQGKFEEAEEHYLLAIQYEPNFQLPRFNLGRLLMTQGKHKEAIQHLQKTLTSEDESTPDHIYTLALAYAHQGDLGKARDYALQAKQKAVGPGQESVADAIEKLLTQLNKMAKPDGQ